MVKGVLKYTRAVPTARSPPWRSTNTLASSESTSSSESTDRSRRLFPARIACSSRLNASKMRMVGLISADFRTAPASSTFRAGYSSLIRWGIKVARSVSRGSSPIRSRMGCTICAYMSESSSSSNSGK